MSDPYEFQVVREALPLAEWIAEQPSRAATLLPEQSENLANAVIALASIEERLRFSRTFASIEDLEDSLRAEQERDALQHIIDCADTPLMRDVLRERAEFEAQLQTALRRLNDTQDELKRTRKIRDEWQDAYETLRDQLETSQEALREIDALDRAGHDSEVAADMGLIARAALQLEEEK